MSLFIKEKNLMKGRAETFYWEWQAKRYMRVAKRYGYEITKFHDCGYSRWPVMGRYSVWIKKII